MLQRRIRCLSLKPLTQAFFIVGGNDMIVQPKVKGFICTTAHPIGCKENVLRQIKYAKSKSNGDLNSYKKVLVIGSSTGYGLASRLAAAYEYSAATLGIMFEKPSNGKRTASAGYYNTRAFEEQAHKDGLYAKTVNGDAFSMEIKQEVIDIIKQDLGQVDLVIYSLAAPRRTMKDGIVYSSVLKTAGDTFNSRSLNLRDNTIIEASIPVATSEEIESTIKVMGGEDWIEWIELLHNQGLLKEGARTIAYSYIGPELTYPIYNDGSIGMAKHHLKKTSDEINERFKSAGIKANISVNKALVTQSSSAIPIVPLYISILYKVMKEAGCHEGLIEQMVRLYGDKLPNEQIDNQNMFRLDDYEMKADIQGKVMDSFNSITSENVLELADVDGYWLDFYNMFGFKIAGVNYEEDVDIL